MLHLINYATKVKPLHNQNECPLGMLFSINIQLVCDKNHILAKANLSCAA